VVRVVVGSTTIDEDRGPEKKRKIERNGD